jgi:hypothetical protein
LDGSFFVGEAVELRRVGRRSSDEVVDCDTAFFDTFEEEGKPGFESGETVGDFGEEGFAVDDTESFAAFDVEPGSGVSGSSAVCLQD